MSIITMLKNFFSKNGKDNSDNYLINLKDYALKNNLLLNDKTKKDEIIKNVSNIYTIEHEEGNHICAYYMKIVLSFKDKSLIGIKYTGTTSKNIDTFLDIFYDKIINNNEYSSDVFILSDQENLLLLEDLGIVKDYKLISNKEKREFAFAICAIVNCIIKYINNVLDNPVKISNELDVADLI